MDSQKNFTALAALYTVTLFGVMFLSGRSTQRSLFEAYIARVKAVELTVSNVDSAAAFYTSSLGFKKVDSLPGSQALLEIPGGVRLQLSRGDVSPHTLYIGVKNGFRAFHRTLIRNSGKSAADPATREPSSISAVFQNEGQKLFIAVDPDLNRTVFFTPNRSQRVPFIRE